MTSPKTCFTFVRRGAPARWAEGGDDDENGDDKSKKKKFCHSSILEKMRRVFFF